MQGAPGLRYACMCIRVSSPPLPTCCSCEMLILQVQSTKKVRLWMWGGISGIGSRGCPAHVALAGEANPGALGWQG